MHRLTGQRKSTSLVNRFPLLHMRIDSTRLIHNNIHNTQMVIHNLINIHKLINIHESTLFEILPGGNTAVIAV